MSAQTYFDYALNAPVLADVKQTMEPAIYVISNLTY